MIVISGTIKIRPDRMDEARLHSFSIMKDSAAEPGCCTYELSAQLSDPLTLRLFEEWESAEALSAHFQTAHFHAFAAALPSLLAAPPTFLRYEVADISPLR